MSATVCTISASGRWRNMYGSIAIFNGCLREKVRLGSGRVAADAIGRELVLLAGAPRHQDQWVARVIKGRAILELHRCPLSRLQGDEACASHRRRRVAVPGTRPSDST